MQRPLFLTGMMGCGKTTVGRSFALDRGLALVDLDHRLERLFGVAVPELLAHGEQQFRARESEALASLLAEPGFGQRAVVVATGGGAVLDAENRRAMDAVGTRVYLEVGVDALVRRLRPDVEAQADARPLLGGDTARLRQRVAELLTARRSIYRSGARCIDADADPSTVVTRVAIALGETDESRGSEAV
ncbi:MAG: shikimate kinase [Deltaproteobacteria bacterium]|nr:shikimate kinase [Deltaproteobacteria bacterium]